MLPSLFFKIAKEISGSERRTVWIAFAKRTWFRSFSPSNSSKGFGLPGTPETPGYTMRISCSAFSGGTLIVVLDFPAQPCLRTVPPGARFGGFALMPSIAMTLATTPGLRYRPRSRSPI